MFSRRWIFLLHEDLAPENVCTLALMKRSEFACVRSKRARTRSTLEVITSIPDKRFIFCCNICSICVWTSRADICWKPFSCLHRCSLALGSGVWWCGFCNICFSRFWCWAEATFVRLCFGHCASFSVPSFIGKFFQFSVVKCTHEENFVQELRPCALFEIEIIVCVGGELRFYKANFTLLLPPFLRCRTIRTEVKTTAYRTSPFCAVGWNLDARSPINVNKP